MPLEINEIGITMRVTDGPRHDTEPPETREQMDERREALIEECVRRVLQALKTERER